MSIAKRAGPTGARLRLVGEPEVDGAALLEGLRAGERWAREELFDRYAALVERTLRRVLGREMHTELSDLIHDCFVEALGSIGRLRDPDAMPGFVRSIAVNVAKKSIRSRRARRWLRFWEPAAMPELPVHDCDPAVRDAYERTYAVLERLGDDDRVAFVLRHVEGLELTEVAEACGVSLATIKRRLAGADKRFAAAARHDPVLRTWLEEGGRWTT